MTMLTDDREMDPAAEGAQARLSTAWHWLCEQRAGAPDTADVWDIRWQHLNTGEGWLTALEGRLLRGTYRLSPLQLYGQGAQRRAVWGAQDALVLKWVALSLQHLLPLHPSCEHVKGHGGGKPSIETLHGLLTDNTDAHDKKTDDSISPAVTAHYRWVCRTDFRGYYHNIRKETLMHQVRQHVISPVLRDLVHQYLHYTVEDGGTFHTPEKGISRGCPLSPLMGALHLYDMDAHFSRQQGIHYVRYMDDVIILAKSRWSLRKQTRQLMQWFSEYGFEAHPDKTFIGRTEKGFDWMGAWLTHEGVTGIAPRAKANHREKVRRLYERLARVPFWKRKRAQKQVHARVSAYRLRWNIWAAGMMALAALKVSPAVAEIVFIPSSTLPGETVWSGTLMGTSGAYVSGPPSVTFPSYSGGHLSNQPLRVARVLDNMGGPSSVISGCDYANSITQACRRIQIPGTTLMGYRFKGNSSFYLVESPVGSATLGSKAWGGGGCYTTMSDATKQQRFTGFNPTGSFPPINSIYTQGTPGATVQCTGYAQNNLIYDSTFISTWSNGCPANGCALAPVSVSGLVPTVRYDVVYSPGGSSVPKTTGPMTIQRTLFVSSDSAESVPLGGELYIPEFRVASVACQIVNTGPSTITFRSDVPISSPSGSTAPLDTASINGLRLDCSGGLAPTEPGFDLGVTFGPASGSGLLSGRTDGVSSLSDIRHYLTLNATSAMCTNEPSNLDLTGHGTPFQVGNVGQGGAPGQYPVAPLYVALCENPAGAAALGQHTIGLTVSSTMY